MRQIIFFMYLCILLSTYAAKIKDLPSKAGYQEIYSDFGNFLGNLDIKWETDPVCNYDGTISPWTRYSYAPVKFPLLSEYEQCADVYMHLYAQYLFNNRKAINFKLFQEKTRDLQETVKHN